jgi:transposase
MLYLRTGGVNMAYIKKEKKGDHVYLRIMESSRDKSGKVCKRSLLNLGNVTNYSPASLRKMGKALYELGGGSVPSETLPKMCEVGRYNYGFVQIYHQILKEYELERFFRRISRRRNNRFNLYHAILLMIIERLNEPGSKLSNFNNQNEYIGLEPIELHNLYRSLDYLYLNQDKVQQLIYSRGRNLFNHQLDVVFYDVTTFYFESEKEDGFRKKGFSKDGKIGNTVIVFGMLIDKSKNPVGYRIYKGGYYEGHTFRDAVRKLKEEYSIDKVITVADRGMMNRENIDLLGSEGIGYEYIIGERLKNLKKDIQDKILDRSKYSKIEITDEDEEDGKIVIEYLVIEYGSKQIITTYSEKRAKKDRYDRQEKIEKAKDWLQNPSKVERKASSHFLKKLGKSGYELDEEKIAANGRYDGFISISTDVKDMPVSEILDSYKQLYKIEHTFRTFKSYLQARPMFHWTEARIEGHLCLCYICFTLLNYLEQKLLSSGIRLSENKIRDAIGLLQVSLIKEEGKEYYIRSRTEENAKAILKQLKIKELPNIIQKYDVTQYISII